MSHPRVRSVLLSRLANKPPGSSQSEILGELRRCILDGEVPSGSPIPADGVAAAFGVSRIPVREALMTLIGEGLVDLAPLRKQTWGSYNIFAFWMSDMRSVGGSPSTSS